MGRKWIQVICGERERGRAIHPKNSLGPREFLSLPLPDILLHGDQPNLLSADPPKPPIRASDFWFPVPEIYIREYRLSTLPSINGSLVNSFRRQENSRAFGFWHGGEFVGPTPVFRLALALLRPVSDPLANILIRARFYLRCAIRIAEVIFFE